MTAAPEGLDLAALQRYLDDRVPEITGPVEAELLHGGRSNLTYRITDGKGAWVLRRPPLGVLTPSAHDMGREYRIVDALQGTAVPVARTVALCEDPEVIGAPFSLVSYVEGTVLRFRTDLDPLPPEDIARCAFAVVDTLAALHAVPYEEVGLGGFGRPQGYLTRQVRRWMDQWHRVATRELPDIERLHARLAASVPEESGASVVHGDARVDNTILDPADLGRVRALVDWEMATLGDPLADLGMLLVYGDPAFEPVLGGSAAATDRRMPARDALAERYARTSGRALDRLDFYLALGYFKLAVIAEGIHARYVQGLTVGPGFETVGNAVPPLVAGGLRSLPERNTR